MNGKLKHERACRQNIIILLARATKARSPIAAVLFLAGVHAVKAKMDEQLFLPYGSRRTKPDHSPPSAWPFSPWSSSLSGLLRNQITRREGG